MPSATYSHTRDSVAAFFNEAHKSNSRKTGFKLQVTTFEIDQEGSTILVPVTSAVVEDKDLHVHQDAVRHRLPSGPIQVVRRLREEAQQFRLRPGLLYQGVQ